MIKSETKMLPVLVGAFLSICILTLLVIPVPTANAGGALCGIGGCLWQCISGFSCGDTNGRCESQSGFGWYQVECNLPI